jgi:mRNA interferase MazF
MSFKKWEIYKADLDPVVGSEQGKSRPVIIISETGINHLINIVNVLPVTTRKEGRIIYPNEAILEAEIHGLPNESIVLCYQIRTLDKQRLSILYGSVTSKEKQNEILNAVCFQLGITPEK